MDKLDKINYNLTEFFSDIVRYIKEVWEFIEKFITRKNALYEGQPGEEETT